MLDVATYEEVEADRRATPHALAIVLLSSLAAGIGASGSRGASDTVAFVAGASMIAVITWAAFAVMLFQVGGSILPDRATRVDVGELLRTLGFAAAPGLLQVFGALPGAAVPVFTVALLWAFAASIVAVRQALDYTSTARAVAACGLAVLLAVGLALTLGLLFGPTLSGT
jgi:hypothetical protein